MFKPVFGRGGAGLCAFWYCREASLALHQKNQGLSPKTCNPDSNLKVALSPQITLHGPRSQQSSGHHWLGHGRRRDWMREKRRLLAMWESRLTVWLWTNYWGLGFTCFRSLAVHVYHFCRCRGCGRSTSKLPRADATRGLQAVPASLSPFYPSRKLAHGICQERREKRTYNAARTGGRRSEP